jgi:hypoxanthine phosphoribosyltransferase
MKTELKLRPLFDQATLKKRIAELGRQITVDYKGEHLVVVGVLKGSFIFLADLVRELNLPVSIEFIGVASYQGTSSTGHVRITHDLASDISDKHVLLVEDIVDSGATVDYLIETFKVRSPKSLKICTLLSKPEAHRMHNHIDYVGFEISKEFVIGYGLDLDGLHRQLPDIMQVITD